MKRDHPNLCQEKFPSGVGATNNSSVGDGSSGGTGNFLMTTIHRKSKVWDETEQDVGVDELLAIFGYKVESSDMAKVAQKLEQLEELMVSVQEDGLSHLASESIHYNPSDLSSRLESMICELNPLLNFDSSSLMQGPFYLN